MIKLKTDARVPTLTYEQWTSLQDQLFMILGGEALSYMGRLPCNLLKQQNDYLYSPIAHAHAQYLESVAWSIITGKPETYPPETHTHSQYGLVLIGEIRLWAAATAPEKWLLCQGQAISRSTYADLFVVLGETYGAGDGTTTFTLPDFRGRTPIGVGQGSGLTARSLAETLGEEVHALTADENATHTHTGPAHTHTLASHAHSIDGEIVNVATGTSGIRYLKVKNGGTNNTETKDSGTLTSNSAGTGNTGAAGSGAAHNTMQPSLGMHFIIYTGVSL